MSNDMKIVFKKNLFLCFLFVYILTDSLFNLSAIGLVQIAVLFIYFMFHFKNSLGFQKYFLLSFILLVVSFVFGSTGDVKEFIPVIKKLSDWAYLSFFLALIQLFFFFKDETEPNDYE